MATIDQEILDLQIEPQQCDDTITSFGRNSIERRPANTISYNEFFWKYMASNRPIILTNVSNTWKCRQNWIINQQDANNSVPYGATINFDYLKDKLGNCTVPVADCSTEYFNSHRKKDMSLFDYLDHWQNKIKLRTSKSYNQDIQIKSITTTSSTTTENLYLKDWHLKALMPNYNFYVVPKQFASDWLNEHLVNNNRDDYRFVYMGPMDTWTPFHADVFGSYSWSTNIVGCKKWILLPPGEELKLADRLGNLPFHINDSILQQHKVKFYTINQEQDEAIFVPSGWYHQVWNLTDTISINHNWFNACNVKRIWNNLASNMQQVINEIDDCRQMDNFDDHCQMLLRASFGMNYFDFLDLLEYIADHRMKFCCNGNENIDNSESITSSKSTIFDKCTLNDIHIRYDLQSIGNVLNLMLQNTTVSNSRTVLYRRCLHLLELIKSY